MEGIGIRSIIDDAESGTLSHLRYMRKSMLMDLVFTFAILAVDLVNMMQVIEMRGQGEKLQDMYFLTPPPILFIALAISATIQFYLLRRLRNGLREISVSDSVSNVPNGGHVIKSVTDINYDIVKAMARSLKIWPVVAFLFVLYFIGSSSMIMEWMLGLSTYPVLNHATVLNVLMLFMAIAFFWIQTKGWMTRRGKLKDLETMEITVLDELKIGP